MWGVMYRMRGITGYLFDIIGDINDPMHSFRDLTHEIVKIKGE